MIITINPAKVAAIQAARDQLGERNGEALTERQRKTKKEEITALIEKGELADALKIATELIA